MKTLVVFVAALLPSMCILSAAMKKSGQFNIVVDLMYPCEDQGTNEAELEMHVYRTQDRNNRTFLYKGSLTWPEDADNAEVQAVLMKKGSTDFELFAIYPRSNFCKLMMFFGDAYSGWCKACNMPVKCPPTAGKISFQEWNIQGGARIPAMEYGHYKMNITVFKQNKMFMCVATIFDIVEKELSVPVIPKFG